MLITKTLYATIIYAIILLTGTVCGFTSSKNLIVQGKQCYHDRILLSASNKKDDASSNAGAGSWRSKAKEFQENPEAFVADKKLNIAFVVSHYNAYHIVGTMIKQLIQYVLPFLTVCRLEMQ